MVVFDPGAPDRFAKIFSLGVHPERRRRIGTRLKLAAIEEFARAGARRYFSEVHMRNEKMLGLNANLGIRTKRAPENGKMLICAADIIVSSRPEAP